MRQTFKKINKSIHNLVLKQIMLHYTPLNFPKLVHLPMLQGRYLLHWCLLLACPKKVIPSFNRYQINLYDPNGMKHNLKQKVYSQTDYEQQIILKKYSSTVPFGLYPTYVLRKKLYSAGAINA